MRLCNRLPGYSQSVLHPHHAPDDPALRIMLPDSDNTPAILAQHPVCPLIPRLVCRQLAAPPAGSRLRLRPVLLAAVPKAPINKDDHALIMKNKIRRGPDGCVTYVKPDRYMPAPTANPHASESLRQTYFRRGITGASDGRHHRRSFPLREYICHNNFTFVAIRVGGQLPTRFTFGRIEKGCGMRPPNEPQCPPP